MRVVYAVALALAVTSVVCADKLILSDGRELTGTVEEDGAYYRIRMRAGEARIPKVQVRQWVREPAEPTDPPRPSPGPAPATPPALEPRSTPMVAVDVSALMLQAEALAAEGKHGEAARIYDRAAAQRPDDPAPLMAAIEAYMAHGNRARARMLLERAREMPAIDQRTVALNIAAVDRAMDKQKRAVEPLAEYLQETPDPDEQALNALGTLLSRLDDDQRKDRIYAKAVQAYNANNRLLEQTRPGERRWGSQWMSAEEYKRQLNAFIAAYAKVKAQEARLRDIRSDIDKTEKQIQIANARMDRGAAQSARTRLNRLKSDENSARAELRRARDAVPWPPFPASVDPVPLALSDTAGQATGASAGAGSGAAGEANAEELAARLQEELKRLEGQDQPAAPETPVVAVAEAATPDDATAALTAPPDPPAEEAVAATPETPATPPAPGRVRPLPAVVRYRLPNGLEITVEELALRRVELAGGGKPQRRNLFDMDEELYTAAQPMTVLRIRVKNVGAGGTEYLGLNGLDELPCAWLTGHGRQKWIPAEFVSGVVRDGIKRRQLAPGDECTDVIVFPPEAFEARSLTMHISGPTYGGHTRVQIPLF